MKKQMLTRKPRAIMAIRFRVAIAGIVICTTSQPAFACAAFDPFTTEEFVSSPLLLVGEITHSQAIVGTNSTLITLQVSERLIGEAASEVTLLWPGHRNNPEPPVWTGNPSVVISAMPPRTGEPKHSELGDLDVHPNLPAIQTSWCGPSGIIPANDAMAGEIRKVITKQRIWNLLALIAVMGPIALALRHLSGASFDRRVQAQLLIIQRQHAERLQLYADRRRQDKDILPR